MTDLYRMFHSEHGRKQGTRLTIPLQERFLPIVMGFVEQSAMVMGLARAGALKLTLSSEELFLHLCHVISSGNETAEIDIRPHHCAVRVDFSFPFTPFSMSAFNMTAGFQPDDPENTEDMRLFLASRSVDRLTILQQDRLLRLSLFKEKSYPAPLPQARPLPTSETGFILEDPDTEEITFCCARIIHDFPTELLPRFIRYPGMLVDMEKENGCTAQIAKSPSGKILGGIFWHTLSEKTIQAFGPYVLASQNAGNIADALIEECIRRSSRTTAAAVICHPPVLLDISRHFEKLGAIPRVSPSGERFHQPVWFRLMHEDTGSVSWTTKDLAEFLHSFYAVHVLPREIRLISDTHPEDAPGSVISADIDRIHSQVTLEWIWPGSDIASNLSRHIHLFESEGFRSILFLVDLGVSWKTGIIPDLIACGFSPRLVLPNAGEGDLAIFDREQEVL